MSVYQNVCSKRFDGHHSFLSNWLPALNGTRSQQKVCLCPLQERSQRILLNIYKQTVLPILDYGCIVWGDCGKRNAQRLERLQNQAMRIILCANRKTCTQEMRAKLVLLSLKNRRRFLRQQLVYKIVNNINCPHQLVNYLVKRSDLHNRSLRDATLLNLPKTKSAMGQSSFQYAAASDWNNLPRALRELKTLSLFKAAVFKYYIELDRKDHVCSI